MVGNLNLLKRKTPRNTANNSFDNIYSKDSNVNNETVNALIEAIRTDNDKMVELIIKNGVNIDRLDALGKTALHYASFEGKFYMEIA